MPPCDGRRGDLAASPSDESRLPSGAYRSAYEGARGVAEGHGAAVEDARVEA